MIPYSRPKLSDLYTLSQSKLLENHTLHSGTYLYSPYMAVPPPGIFQTFARKTEVEWQIIVRLMMVFRSLFITDCKKVNWACKANCDGKTKNLPRIEGVLRATRKQYPASRGYVFAVWAVVRKVATFQCKLLTTYSPRATSANSPLPRPGTNHGQTPGFAREGAGG